MKFTKRASLCGAFFVVACFIYFSFASVSVAACGPFKEGALAEVTYVYDGDTLKLADGRKVRLIGINTPEIVRDGLPDEPGAAIAKQRLEAILRASNNRVFLKTGKEQRDRYSRYLAHPYNNQGRSITEILLREGLGYAIYIPPNLTNLDCFRLAEKHARTGRQGIWKQNGFALDVYGMNGQEEGFYHIQGEIGRIGKSRRSLWLDLKQGPSIRIDWSDWGQFKEWHPDEMVGRRLEVRGWIYRRKGQQRMQVRHPAAVRWLETETWHNNSILRFVL